MPGAASSKGAQGREGRWVSFPSLPFHPGHGDPSGTGGETVRDPRCGRERTPPGAGQVADPQDPARGGRRARVRPDPRVHRARPLPSPRPLPSRVPPPSARPPPCRLREAGTRRWRRRLPWTLSHSLGSLAVAAPSEAEQQPRARRQRVEGVDGRRSRRTDGRTESGQPDGRVAAASTMSWGTELWVSGGARGPGPEGAGGVGAADRRRPRPWRWSWGSRSPLCAALSAALPPRAPAAAGPGQRPGRRRGRPRAPAPAPSAAFTFRARPRRSPLYLGARRRGRGPHCPGGALVAGGEGARAADPRTGGGPRGEGVAGPGRAGSRPPLAPR